MPDIAQLGFRVDTRGLKEGTKELSRMDKAGAAVGATGKGLTSTFLKVGGALGLAGLAKDAFDTFRSFESMKMSLKTVTGSAVEADKAFSRIQKFAAETPYTLDQSVMGFQKLKALGLDPSIASLRSYGNTAAAMGKDLSQMIEAVADASTFEFERLKEFGIKAKQEKDKVIFTFQGVTTEVAKNSQAIQQYLLDIGNVKFGSAMADQMDTVNGAMSNLSDSWSQLQLALLSDSGAGEHVKTVIQGLSSAVSWMTEQVKIAADGWNDLAHQFNTGTGPIGVIADALRELNKLVNFVRNSFEALGATLRQVGSDAMQGFTNGMKSKIADAKSWAKRAASEIHATIKGYFKSKSPSRLMYEEGINVMDGIALGIAEGKGTAINEMTLAAIEVASAFDEMDYRVQEWQRSFVDALFEGKEGIKDFFKTLIIESAKAQVQSSLFGGDGKSGPLGNIFGNVIGSLFGFATGGSFTVGGSGGTDSQLVAFKATPGEKVTVNTPQQASGGATVNYAPVINAQSGVDREYLAQVLAAQQQDFYNKLPSMMNRQLRKGGTTSQLAGVRR